jgi:diaminopimelate decarboxylase
MNKTQLQTHYLTHSSNDSFLESVSLTELARIYGTPSYVYTEQGIKDAVCDMQKAFEFLPTLLCFSVKANSNLHILKLLAQLGMGFDIVSGGELYRVLQAGGRTDKVVFSGVGKHQAEIEMALYAGIRCFNVESEQELRRISHCAVRLGLVAPISLRINPDVSANTHPYISTGLKENKFGIAHHEALSLFHLARELPFLDVVGVDCHIGSQILELAPFRESLEKMMELYHQLIREGFDIRHLDLGGGVGIRYQNENTISMQDYAEVLRTGLSSFTGELILEPGRRIIGPQGLLLTRVEYVKHSDQNHFLIVDAAMNDLIRPALYQAWHEIVAVNGDKKHLRYPYTIVGPVCESGDTLGVGREIGAEQGDLLAILTAGAYGSSMGSTYNARPRPPEILVNNNGHRLIRRRESMEELIQLETGL